METLGSEWGRMSLAQLQKNVAHHFAVLCPIVLKLIIYVHSGQETRNITPVVTCKTWDMSSAIQQNYWQETLQSMNSSSHQAFSKHCILFYWFTIRQIIRQSTCLSLSAMPPCSHQDKPPISPQNILTSCNSLFHFPDYFPPHVQGGGGGAWAHVCKHGNEL